MQIGEVIRKHRKNKNMTQEEMADRLGVTAPAVNKWENGNSYPDITLLSPIARLLGITPDTLLSFQEELTAEEISGIVKELNDRIKTEPYEEVFQWAKGRMEEYPNCEQLSWQAAQILDGWRVIQDLADAEKYDEYILGCYTRALKSDDEDIRGCAADSLFAYYMRKEQFERAEEYLQYFSKQNPNRKRKQAQIYGEMGRIQEAYQAYEEILFSGCQTASAVFYGMFQMAVREQDRERAEMLVRKQQELAQLFEMGKYHEAACKLELAKVQNDAEAVKRAMEEILSSVESICDFQKAPLYAHMKFRELEEDFYGELKEKLRDSFQKEVEFGSGDQSGQC